MKSISIVMALWKEGYFSEKEVIAWADAQILKSENDPADSLIELSLKGPSYCAKLDSYVFPVARVFSFSERFAIRLEALNWNSKESIMEFIDWSSRAAMGEDLKVPEVLFGYCLDEEFCYDKGNPLKLFNEEIEFLKPKSKIIFEGIMSELNA
jgi:hypothetical protein